MMDSGEPDKGLRCVVVAIVGAMVSFVLVGTGIYWKLANVRMNGFVHGGPAMMRGAMGGLFGGGLVALLVLVLLLQRR
ncbi:MAG: hypothetical protein ACRD3K_09790 [Edaphobacter sp.]